ncbi:DUF485 domain-containing protein [Streptomyces sp. NPDC048290]|uniref:DUF485 domain-containing protein n=1 Tax=Streptomyces sp. NPDC048290 TaxID=3155811 RepID=UPI00342DF6C4
MHASKGRPVMGAEGQGSPPENDGGAEPTSTEVSGADGYADPWYDAIASGWGESAVTGADQAAGSVPGARRERDGGAADQVDAGEIYLAVQRSEAFREVRGRYRRFVVPAVIGFLAWYLAYVVLATVAPGLMARPVVGAVNVAMVAGLGQFLTTFLLTWAYARHARLRRDRAALELRWDTQEMTRAVRGGAW